MDMNGVRKMKYKQLFQVHSCNKCGYLIKNREWYPQDYRCPNCGNSRIKPKEYFHNAFGTLANLIQNYYQLVNDNNFSPETPIKPYDIQLTVVIFFCSFVEVLLEHFLRELMSSKGVSKNDQEKKLVDYKFVYNRVNNLFNEYTGEKWKVVVADLSRSSKERFDYKKVNDFYVNEARKARIEFLHKGDLSLITPEMPKECNDNIPPLVSLFVDLHNRYNIKKS